MSQPDPSVFLEVLAPVVARVRTDVSAMRGADGQMWRSDDALTRARLLSHVQSGAGGAGVVRGAYIMPVGDVCRAAVLDLDDHDGSTGWEEMVRVAARVLRCGARLGLRGNPWRSRGGRGVHIWYLWDEPQDARSVRAALARVLSGCMLRSGAGGLSKGEVEIFPKQDVVEPGGYGNQVWLPLGGKSLPLVEECGLVGGLVVMEREALATFVEVCGWRWHTSKDVEVLPRAVHEPRGAGALVVLDEAAISAKAAEARAWLGFIKDYSYDQWLRVGMCLHHGLGASDEGLALWEAWSMGGDGFEDGACAAKWATFGVSGERDASGQVLSLGSLKKWARDAGWVEDVAGMFDVVGVEAAGVGKDPVAQDLPAFERDAEGRIQATSGNIMLALARADVTGYRLGYDSFRDELMFQLGGGGGGSGVSGWQGFSDVHYNRIKCALENRGKGFKPINRTDIKECVLDMAVRNQFDSARVWLEGLVWDGVPRVGGFLGHYWGAQDNEYTRAVSLYMWTALAGRIMQPGCEVHMMPILVGDEGAGKSSTIKALVPDPAYFCEISFDEDDDKQARKLRGVLAVEVSELRGLGTRDEESIYAFVTRSHEKWVPKYREFTTTFPRRCMLFGTSNDAEFLSKEGRRWLPFNIGARAGRLDSDMRPDLVARDRNQLWAEGLALWRASGIAWQDAMRLGPAARASYVMTHPWEEQIASYLSEYEAVMVPDKYGKVFVPSSKLWSHALNMSGRMTGADGRTLAKVMLKLGYERAKSASQLERGWSKQVREGG